ncbi:MAG: hypothetical protein ACK40K_00455 [Raineya sp.]
MEDENITPFAKRLLEALETGRRTNLQEILELRAKKIAEKEKKKKRKKR